jgi:hypothetical protein
MTMQREPRIFHLKCITVTSSRFSLSRWHVLAKSEGIGYKCVEWDQLAQAISMAGSCEHGNEYSGYVKAKVYPC